MRIVCLWLGILRCLYADVADSIVSCSQVADTKPVALLAPHFAHTDQAFPYSHGGLFVILS